MQLTEVGMGNSSVLYGWEAPCLAAVRYVFKWRCLGCDVCVRTTGQNTWMALTSMPNLNTRWTQHTHAQPQLNPHTLESTHNPDSVASEGLVHLVFAQGLLRQTTKPLHILGMSPAHNNQFGDVGQVFCSSIRGVLKANLPQLGCHLSASA